MATLAEIYGTHASLPEYQASRCVEHQAWRVNDTQCFDAVGHPDQPCSFTPAS